MYKKDLEEIYEKCLKDTIHELDKVDFDVKIPQRSEEEYEELFYQKAECTCTEKT